MEQLVHVHVLNTCTLQSVTYTCIAKLKVIGVTKTTLM